MRRSELRFNGWGKNDQSFDLDGRENAVWRWVFSALEIEPREPTPPPVLDDIDLPQPRLAHGVLGKLEGMTVHTEKRERAFHARGQSYHDLLYYRQGKLDAAPDAVIYPRTADEVVTTLAWARDHAVAVVPFGGGTSVVGGVTARGESAEQPTVTLDTCELNRFLGISETAMTATAEAGIYGPRLEQELGKRGVTLGHFPQSFEFSTLGGWIAASGAGQQSNRYGKAASWFLDAELATAEGRWHSERFPASAAGPHIGQLLVGSEGLLGVITEATIRVHPAPERKAYRGYLLPNFDAGVDAVRALAQSGIPLAMIRLSDADETHFQAAFASEGKQKGLFERTVKRILGWRGFGREACLLLIGSEGTDHAVRRALADTAGVLKRFGAFALGERPGEHWYRGRFNAPYLRDPLMDRGLGVDTLETSIRWDGIRALHDVTRRAIRESLGEKAIVMAHISHTYRDGASLYFTFVFDRDPNDPIGQWNEVKRSASDALCNHGGTISHHHGVGEDHLPWMEQEKGAFGLNALRALKKKLDPEGILNPGKLIP